MPELRFAVTAATVDARALTPVLRFALEVEETTGVRIDTVVLQCQIMIEARRRTYDDSEREALLDLFGAPSRWGSTLKTMLWTHASTTVPGFDERTSFELPIACTYDLSVASAKYFFGLRGGEVPLTFQFSGTVFYRDEDGALQIARVPWTVEASFRLPVTLWQKLIAEQYPDRAFVGLDRGIFEKLYQYRVRHQDGTWDAAVERLLSGAAAPSGGNGSTAPIVVQPGARADLS